MAKNSIIWHINKDVKEQNEALAERISKDILLQLKKKREVILCVPGGNTPLGFLESLSHIDLDWSRVKVLLNDDRCVPFTNSESNYSMLVKVLKKSFAENIQLVPLYLPSCTIEENIINFNNKISTVMPLDICVLGMGADGHTASLFPETENLSYALDVTNNPRLISATPKNKTPRVSLNLSALLSADHNYLLIRGKAKREIAEKASKGENIKWPISYFFSKTTANVYYTNNIE